MHNIGTTDIGIYLGFEFQDRLIFIIQDSISYNVGNMVDECLMILYNIESGIRFRFSVE